MNCEKWAHENCTGRHEKALDCFVCGACSEFHKTNFSKTVHKIAFRYRSAYPTVPQAEPGCAPTRGAKAYFTGF